MRGAGNSFERVQSPLAREPRSVMQGVPPDRQEIGTARNLGRGRSKRTRCRISALLSSQATLPMSDQVHCCIIESSTTPTESSYVLPRTKRKDFPEVVTENKCASVPFVSNGKQIARSLATGRLLPDSVMSDESSFGRRSDDHGGSRIMSSEEERAREVMESDCDSYSTGESETEVSDSLNRT